LTDKNGKKIFEGDILLRKTTEKHWCQWESVGIVKFGNYDFRPGDYGFKTQSFYIEKIKSIDGGSIPEGICQDYTNDECYPIEIIGNKFTKLEG